MTAAVFAAFGAIAFLIALSKDEETYARAGRWSRKGWLITLGLTTVLTVALGPLGYVGVGVAGITFYAYALPALGRVGGARPATGSPTAPVVVRPAAPAAGAPTLVVRPTPTGPGSSPSGGDDVQVALGPCIGGLVTMWAIGHDGVAEPSRWRVDDPGALEQVLLDPATHRSALRSARTEQVAQDVAWVRRETWANRTPHVVFLIGRTTSDDKTFVLRWPQSAADAITTTAQEITSTFVARLQVAARTGTRLGAFRAGGTAPKPSVVVDVRDDAVRLSADRRPTAGLWWQDLDRPDQWTLEVASTDAMWRVAANQLHRTMRTTYAVPPGDVVVGYLRAPAPNEG